MITFINNNLKLVLRAIVLLAIVVYLVVYHQEINAAFDMKLSEVTLGNIGMAFLVGYSIYQIFKSSR